VKKATWGGFLRLNNKELINRIINLRESKDWTQAELGRKIGLEKSAMNKVESGSRKITTEELQKLSKVFNVTTDYLLGINQTPAWADDKDLVELDKLLESNVNMAYGGETLTPEQIQRVKDILTATFWDLKEANKRKEK
jgi:transcriptional regulator with XRE-family HTH domain